MWSVSNLTMIGGDNHPFGQRGKTFINIFGYNIFIHYIQILL